MTKGWKRIGLFALSLAVTLSTALPPETIARAGVVADDGSDGDISPTAEVYHSEQHKKVSTLKGDVELDTEVTTIAPAESDEYSHLSVVADQAIADFENTGKEPLLFVEHDGTVEEVSKTKFVAKLREIARGAVADFKVNPRRAAVLSISRGAVNGIVVGALLVHEGFPHTASLVGASTVFVESLLCQLLGRAITIWVNKSHNFPMQFLKGIEMSEVYLAVLRLTMLATGHPLDPTLWGSVIHNTTDSFVGNLSQEPANIVIAQRYDEDMSAGSSPTRALAWRDTGYFAVSAFVAVVTAMHLSANPHVRTMAQLLNLTLAVPSVIYLGYKQNWIKSVRAGWDRVAVALSAGPLAVARGLYFGALKKLGKIKAENPETVPDSIATAAERQAEDARQEICNGGMSEI